jgi:hypothetical protein
VTYVVVPDKSVDDVFTELMWDTYIRDNFNNGVMRPIAETLLGSAASFIEFTSIPATHSHLMLVLAGRGDTGSSPAVFVRFNGDTGSNYDNQALTGQGSTAAASEGLGTSFFQVGNVPGPSDIANAVGHVVAHIPDYAGTVFHKSISARGTYKTATSSGGVVIAERSGHWRSTAAITSVSILLGTGSLLAGTKATLYGLAGI